MRGGEGTRPCRDEDFCILLRSRGDFPVYEAALRAAGIPVFADAAADLMDAPHVRPFAALLRIIDNPAQDVELSAVLLSPLYDCRPDDLVRLRGKVPGGSLYAAVRQGDPKRFGTFLDDLQTFRRLARTLTVPALIEELSPAPDTWPRRGPCPTVPAAGKICWPLPPGRPGREPAVCLRCSAP